MTSLTEAFNARLSGADKAVPVVAAPAPAQMAASVAADPAQVRGLRAGERGTNMIASYPEIPYSTASLAVLLKRTKNGCQYMLENLEDPKGESAVGILIDVIESTHLMLIGYLASGILNSEDDIT